VSVGKAAIEVMKSNITEISTNLILKPHEVPLGTDLKVFYEANLCPQAAVFAEVPLRTDLKVFHEAKLCSQADVFAEVPL